MERRNRQALWVFVIVSIGAGLLYFVPSIIFNYSNPIPEFNMPAQEQEVVENPSPIRIFSLIILSDTYMVFEGARISSDTLSNFLLSKDLNAIKTYLVNQKKTPEEKIGCHIHTQPPAQYQSLLSVLDAIGGIDPQPVFGIDTLTSAESKIVLEVIQ
ncbi:MAG: hypothetical protein KDE26_17820 [Bacteroidetes bacterium]|nr:hypothetical protein [Bacteroidota bacterium]